MRLRRTAAFALAAGSILASANDWFARPDLWAEASARILLASLALFVAVTARRTPGEQALRVAAFGFTIDLRSAQLLVVALFGFSLDLYWQTAYPNGFAMDVAMVVKYAGVALGSATLLIIAAGFGTSRERRIRPALQACAPYFGMLLFGVGVVHGSSWIAACERGCDVSTAWGALGLRSYDAYLALDILVRVAIVVTIGLGAVYSSGLQAQRLRIAATFCVPFAFGTAVDFCARFVPAAVAWGNLPDAFDAFTTLLFPIGLVIAIGRKAAFDLEYAVDRAIVYSIVATLLGMLWATADWLVHQALDNVFGRALGDGAQLPVGIALAAILSPLFSPLEHRTSRAVGHVILPNRRDRLDILRRFGERISMNETLDDLERHLFKTLGRGANVSSVRVFVRANDDYIQVMPQTPAPVPTLAGARVRALLTGRDNRPHPTRGDTLLPDAELLLPMPVAGSLFGLMACGAKRVGSANVAYARDEIREFALIARETGATLFALRAAAVAP